MIHIVHSSNEVANRNYLLKLKNADTVVLSEFKSKDISFSEALTIYCTNELFGGKTVICVDITSDKSFDYEKVFEKLAKTASQNDLVFLSNETLSKSHPLRKFSASLNTTFYSPEDEKQNVFSFLDALFERNRARAYKELDILIKGKEDVFGIFSMISYGARNIAFALFESKAFFRLHPFVKGKTAGQAKSFTKAEISSIIKLLYDFDLGLKTGKTSIDVVLPVMIEKITGSL